MDSTPEATRYLIPAERHRVTDEIKRSRFITTVAYAPTVEAARSLVAEVSSEFPDASHNCWAYIVGPPGSTVHIGLSDDGEPHGTAGRPMLTVLLHCGIGDICAVVTRYFGGTLLGKGGLVQAYSAGVQLALAGLPTTERIQQSVLHVILDYSAITLFKRLLPGFEAEILQEAYGIDAEYLIRLPVAHEDQFCGAVTSLTSGRSLIEVTARDT